MEIGRNGIVYELTEDELRLAFEEHQQSLWRLDAARHLEEYIDAMEVKEEDFFKTYGLSIEDALTPLAEGNCLLEAALSCFSKGGDCNIDEDSAWQNTIQIVLCEREAYHKATRKLDATLQQKPHDTGFTRAEIDAMLNRLELEPDEEVSAVTIEGEHSWAMGYIRQQVLDEVLSYDLSGNGEFATGVCDTLNDIQNETKNGRYIFAGVLTRLDY